MTSDLSELQDDMESDPVAAPSGDALTQLQSLGKRVLTIDEQLAELEDRIKKRKAVRNDILSRDMPALMTQHNVDFVGVGGKRFVLDDFYHASIKADAENAAEAYDWLESNDYGAIIKYTVTAEFPKDSTEQVQALATYIRQRYQDASVTVARGVPWARLTSWLKETFERRRVDSTVKLPPLELMGATVGQMVKIDEPRKKRR